MGFLGKLFRKKKDNQGSRSVQYEQPDFETTNDLMQEEQFWQLVGEAQRNSSNMDEQEALLQQSLTTMPLKDVVGFYSRTEQLKNAIYTSEMWCAGYIMNGGCSDDMFEYFLLWVISCGREVYEAAKENPDNLDNYLTDDDNWEKHYDFESFNYIGIEVFEARTNKDLYDFLGDMDSGDVDLDLELNWDEDEPETMQKICPKLFARFWED